MVVCKKEMVPVNFFTHRLQYEKYKIFRCLGVQVVKLIVFTLGMLILLGGCGQKSVIKNDVRAVRTAEAYGDGRHTILPIVIPLSEQSIASFESPLKKMAFVRGFAKMFYDLGANLGLGKAQLTLVQPIPELPTEFLQGVRIKRIFFYIEPGSKCYNEVDENTGKVECIKKKSRRRFSWLGRIWGGFSNVDFKFLDKIAVKASSRPMQNVTNWTPMVSVEDMSRRDFHPLQKLFKEEVVENNENSKEIILLKYSRMSKETDTVPLSPIFIMNLREGYSPSKMKNFLMDYPKFRGAFKRIHILNQSLLLELKNDPVTVESFQLGLSESAEAVDNLGVDAIEPCDDVTCLDLKVPNVNLVPLLNRGNGVQVNSYIDVGKVPSDFQLKGFIEFEVKLNLPF
jgi:hypothetical protein